MSDADDFISRNRGIYGFIADEDPKRPVDEWEPFVRDLLAERDGLKDQLAKSEQAREDAIIERAAEIGRLKDQLAEQAKLVADTQSDLFRVSDRLAEADANGLRLAEKVEQYQAHIRSESSRLAQIDADRERLRAEKAELIQAKVDLRAAFDAQVSRASLAEAKVERLRAVIDEFFCGNVPHGLQEALEGSTNEAPNN